MYIKLVHSAVHNTKIFTATICTYITLEKYEQLFAEDPFSDEAIFCGAALMTALSEAREKKCLRVAKLLGTRLRNSMVTQHSYKLQ